MAIQTGQFLRENRVQIVVRVAADGGVGRLQRDVGEVVEAGEEADLGELADAGEQREADVRVAGLHHGVQTAQEVAVGASYLRRLERIENRLVVLVH